MMSLNDRLALMVGRAMIQAEVSAERADQLDRQVEVMKLENASLRAQVKAPPSGKEASRGK